MLDGKYHLLAVLGAGGGGTVHEARQLSTGRTVAVKLLNAPVGLDEASRQRQRRRFRREMEICARLEHPDIVRLIDFGSIEGTDYSVFERVHGRPLSDLIIQHGGLPIMRLLALMDQLLNALAYAAAQGVIHRDIKPSNLMVVGEGEPERIKVLDFGISALKHPADGVPVTRLTLSNELVGTPAYAAPEQLRGHDATLKSDLYSFALVLLEGLTGTPAVTGSSVGEIFQRQLSPLPIELPEVLREHPLGAILRRALEKNPDRRIGSYEELQHALRGLHLASLVNAGGFLNVGVERAEPSPLAFDRTLGAGAASTALERRPMTALACVLHLRAAMPVSSFAVDRAQRELMATVLSTCERHGGRLAGTFGAQALFYFGAERISDADLELVARAIAELRGGVERWQAESRAELDCALAVGLHHGMVVVEGRLGTPEPHSTVATYATTIATPAEGRSDRAHVVVRASEDVARLISRYRQVEIHAEAELEVVGQRAPLRLFRLEIGELTVDGPAPLRLVGREPECARLLAAWQASRVAGHTVVVFGEAGVGKTRLVQEFAWIAGCTGHGVPTIRCAPAAQGTALGPLLEFVSKQLGASPGARFSALEEAIQALGIDSGPAVDILANWLSIETSTVIALSPQKQRELLCGLLVEILQKSCKSEVGFLRVEDLHWADQSTLNLLGHLAERLRETGGFALMTARPELSLAWSPEVFTPVSLDPLKPEDLKRLVETLPGGEALDPRLRAALVERSAGNPLFLEELVHAATRSKDEGTHTPFEVPPTLRALVFKRLMSLGSARATAQCAAAIGREFDQLLLLRSCASAEEIARSDLEELAHHGLLVRTRRDGEWAYAFRHALLREAAYESMAPERQTEVHAAISGALRRHFPGIVSRHPETLAHHLEVQGDLLAAQEFWLRAAEVALGSSSHDEAIGSLRRGLAVVARCEPGARTLQAEIDHRNALGSCLIAKRGYGDPEAYEAFKRAHALLEEIPEDPERAFRTRWGLFNLVYQHSDQARALSLAESLASGEAPRPEQVLAQQSAICRCHMTQGNFDLSITAGDRLAAPADARAHRAFSSQFGEDPYTSGRTFQLFSLVFAGRVDEGVTRARALAELARSVDVPHTAILSLAQIGHMHLFRGMDNGAEDFDALMDYTSEAIRIAEATGFPFFSLYANLLRAAGEVQRGNGEVAPALEQGIAIWRAAGSQLLVPELLCFLGEGQRLQGDSARAEQTLLEAKSLAQSSGERYFEPEILRMLARLCDRRDPDSNDAERHLIDAITLSRSQGAHLSELRAACDLAELLSKRRGAASGDPWIAPVAAWWLSHDQGLQMPLVDAIRRHAGRRAFQ